MKKACFVCGNIFDIKPSRVARVSDSRVTCSRECSYEKKTIVNNEKIFEKIGTTDLKVWLFKKYVTEKKSTSEISLLIYGNKSCKTSVAKMIKENGIEIRNPSDAVKLQWVGNDERKSKQAEFISLKVAEGTPAREKLKTIMKSEEYRSKHSVAKTGDRNGMKGIFGDAHPRWDVDRTSEQRKKERKTDKDKPWRLAVFRRDGFACTICKANKSGNLVAHHLNGYHWNIEGRHDVDNGKTLCVTCHKEFHTLFGYRNNTVEQMEEYELNRVNERGDGVLYHKQAICRKG